MTENPPSLQRQSGVDVGYNRPFEQAWGRFERYVWATISLLILVGIAGVFGRGPLNLVSRTLPGNGMVQYERIVRFKTPTVIRFALPVDHPGTVSIQLDAVAFERLGLQTVVPQATKSLGSPMAGHFVFDTDSPQTKLVFVGLSLQPSTIGPVRSNYLINGQIQITLDQFVLP